MKTILTAAIISLAAAPAFAQVTGAETRRCGDYGQPAEGMPEEFGQFAFLIGDFDVGSEPWDPETGRWGEAQYYARWNGYYGFGGRAIFDEWYDPGYGYREGSGAGINIRLWDAASGQWHTAWHYTANNEVRELRQEVREDGLMWLWQVYPEAPERRVFFEVYEDGEWARISQVQDEATGEWVNSVRLHARPADCG